MKALVIIAVAALGLAPAAHAGARSPQSVSTEWAADWSAKKLDATLALYAPAPVFLPTVGPRWAGLSVLRTNFAGLLANYNPHITLHSLKAETSGDLAYDDGVYEETITSMKDGKVIAARGSYLFVFRRDKHGRWKIQEQTFSSYDPPPAL